MVLLENKVVRIVIIAVLLLVLFVGPLRAVQRAWKAQQGFGEFEKPEVTLQIQECEQKGGNTEGCAFFVAQTLFDTEGDLFQAQEWLRKEIQNVRTPSGSDVVLLQDIFNFAKNEFYPRMNDQVAEQQTYNILWEKMDNLNLLTVPLAKEVFAAREIGIATSRAAELCSNVAAGNTTVNVLDLRELVQFEYDFYNARTTQGKELSQQCKDLFSSLTSQIQQIRQGFQPSANTLCNSQQNLGSIAFECFSALK
jgi:hypothetical protein